MAEATEIETKKIAGDGDVILIVGEPAEAKLLVHSVVLTAASKVFSALLGPNFREGQAVRSSEQPKEIKLPEDDARAMSDMCHLLHGKHVDELLKAVTSARVLSYAIVVDKYACVDALRMQSHAILFAHLDYYTFRLDMTINGRMVVATYLLEHAPSFKRATKRLIIGVNEQYSDLLKRDFGPMIPLSVLLAAEEKRTTAQRKVITDLPLLGMPDCPNESCDNYDDEYIARLCTAFGCQHWPPDFRPGNSPAITKLIDEIQVFGNISIRTKCEHTASKSSISRQDFVKFTADLRSTCAGLCLHCVKEGNPDLVTKCTVQAHSYP